MEPDPEGRGILNRKSSTPGGGGLGSDLWDKADPTVRFTALPAKGQRGPGFPAGRVGCREDSEAVERVLVHPGGWVL